MSTREVSPLERLEWDPPLPKQESKKEKKAQDKRIVVTAKNVSNTRSPVKTRISELGASGRSIKVVQERLFSLTLDDRQLQEKHDRELLFKFIQEIRRANDLLEDGNYEGENSAIDTAIELSSKVKDINIQNEDGDTFLHLAFSNGILQLALNLLLRGARLDINNRNNAPPFPYIGGENGNTILHYFFNQPIRDLDDQLAINENSVEFCEKLLAAAPGLINEKNNDGVTPLMYACINGYIECVKFLVRQAGINLNVVDSLNKTAAHYAIRTKNPEIIESVLSNYPEYVKDITIDQPIDRDGNTLLHYVFKLHNLKLIPQFFYYQGFYIPHYELPPFFVCNSIGVTPISYIATSKDLQTNRACIKTIKWGIDTGDEKLLESYLNEIAKLDQETKDFILSLSIVDKCYEIARQLLKKGADCNAPINQEILVQYEYDYGDENKMPVGSNVLMFLIYVNYRDPKVTESKNKLIRTILDECNVNFGATAGGLNLLQFACLRGNIELFNELLGKGVNIEAVGTEGKWNNVSVLVSAIIGDSAVIVDTLFERLDFSGEKHSHGLIAFDYAVEERDLEIVCKLLQHNFSVDHTIKNFIFFIRAYKNSYYEGMESQFKKVIQEMLSICPEFLLRLAISIDGVELFRSLDNTGNLAAIAESFMEIDIIIKSFSDFGEVIVDLDKNNLDSLRNYLINIKLTRIGVNALRTYIENIAKEARVTDAWKMFENTFLRYDQISNSSIEVSKIHPYENFNLALFIESNIVKIEKVTKMFFKEMPFGYLPRSIIFHERTAVILSSSKDKLEGGEKCINNGALISLDNILKKPESVVVAKIKPSNLKADGGIYAENFRMRLAREWEIMNKFKGMEGFVQGHYFFDIKSKSGNIRYVMEKYEGDISEFVYGFLTLEQQILVAEQAIYYLKTMHDMKIMHRDIKPKNILFRRDVNQNVKIAFTDFGSSKALEDNMHGGFKYGTTAYNSPEVVLIINKRKPPELDITEQAKKMDIFALGLTLFELSYGEIFHLNVKKIELSEYIRLYNRNIKSKLDFLLGLKVEPTLRQRYDMVILKMLSYEPKDRITLEAALQEISEIIPVNI